MLIVIGAWIGLGNALMESSEAAVLSGLLLDVLLNDLLMVLTASFVLTTLLTDIISNIAVVTLLFPIDLTVGEASSVSLPAATKIHAQMLWAISRKHPDR